MSFSEMIGLGKIARQLQKEIKEPGFSFKIMALKALRTVGWTLLGILGVAAAGYLMDTPAIKMALTNAGLSDAMAGVIAMGLLWLGRSISNAVANAKTKESPVDGAPINVQAAQKSGPVLTTQEQMSAFMKEYNAQINDGVPFDKARTRALEAVTGLEIEIKK